MHGVLWMSEENRKKLVARLRRVAGQIRALEGEIKGEPDKVVNQFLAVIAASKAVLRYYLEVALLEKPELSVGDRQLLAKLLNRVD